MRAGGADLLAHRHLAARVREVLLCHFRAHRQRVHQQRLPGDIKYGDPRAKYQRPLPKREPVEPFDEGSYLVVQAGETSHLRVSGLGKSRPDAPNSNMSCAGASSRLAWRIATLSKRAPSNACSSASAARYCGTSRGSTVAPCSAR